MYLFDRVFGIFNSLPLIMQSILSEDLCVGKGELVVAVGVGGGGGASACFLLLTLLG